MGNDEPFRSAPAAVTPACLALKCCMIPSASCELRLASTRANWVPSPSLLRLPCRPRVSGVAERSAAHFDPGRQGLHRVVRSRPAPPGRADLGTVAIADHPPVEGAVGFSPRIRSRSPSGAYTGRPCRPRK